MIFQNYDFFKDKILCLFCGEEYVRKISRNTRTLYRNFHHYFMVIYSVGRCTVIRISTIKSRPFIIGTVPQPPLFSKLVIIAKNWAMDFFTVRASQRLTLHSNMLKNLSPRWTNRFIKNFRVIPLLCKFQKNIFDERIVKLKAL